MLHGNALYVICEETWFKMTADEWMEVAELQSTQEEADTRLLLNALHAARTGSNAVIVTSKYTDVMFLCLAFQKDIPCPIYHKCGTQNSTRLEERSANWPGHWETASVIGLNAFTGCDTVIAFASRRTLSAMKPMNIGIAYLETFSQVGQSWDVQPQLSEKVQQFTCRMYVAASSTTEVNDLRCQLFCAKRGDIESGCYHHADIVSSCTSFEQTTRQQAGRAVYMLVPHCQTLPSVDG